MYDELTWLATKLIPGVRASRPDLTARHQTGVPLAGHPRSGEWFARATVRVGGHHRADLLAHQRVARARSADVSPHLASDLAALEAFSRVATIVFFQFWTLEGVEDLRVWAQDHREVSRLERTEISFQAAAKRRAFFGSGSLYIWDGTVDKVRRQIRDLCVRAVTLGVGELDPQDRLRVELLAAGTSFADAINASELLVV